MSEFPPVTTVPPPVVPYDESEPVEGASVDQPSVDQPSVKDPSVKDPSVKDPSVKDKATDAADAGKQAVGELAQTATDKTRDVARETSKQARDLLGEARTQLGQQAATQHRGLVDNLRSLSAELGAMTEHSEQSGVATNLVGQARDRVEGVAGWLDQREPGDLLAEARDFARRRPGAFLLGAVVAGVLAGRLTRGVVAAHTDDSPDSAQLPSATTPAVDAADLVPYSDTTNGYAPDVSGYSQPGLDTAAGFGTEHGFGAGDGLGR